MKDRVDSNGISIAYCSTEYMLAGFFTKALKKEIFMRFREVLLEWEQINNLQMGAPSINECVGNMDEVE